MGIDEEGEDGDVVMGDGEDDDNDDDNLDIEDDDGNEEVDEELRRNIQVVLQKMDLK